MMILPLLVAAVSALEELLPVPVKVEAQPGFADEAALRAVAVVHATVTNAPAATADEAYVLEVRRDGVTVTASSRRGEIWAKVTLDQLAKLSGGKVPCCRITDWPYLKWRGFMPDTARNYLDVPSLKDAIDMMSRYKLNLLHWHLSENYAWRLESKRHPELQQPQAFLVRHKGKYYTQEEFREIADYAYARGVSLMPELDVPGHALAFRHAFGFTRMNDPKVTEIVADLFDELCTLVPAEKMPFVHMGTDEVWNKDMEGAEPGACTKWANAIAAHGRRVVSWVPGQAYQCSGKKVGMLWAGATNVKAEGSDWFDANGMYIETFDPFEVLPCAAYYKPAAWTEPGDGNLGAIFCAWHDGAVGDAYANMWRNLPVFTSCVLFGDNYWRGRKQNWPQYKMRLPRADDPLLREAADLERRTIAQRDKALKDLKHPFHFLRQTDMRWRLSRPDGTVIARDIAQATISPFKKSGSPLNYLEESNGVVVAETWIRSPKTQKVGAWIGFTNISRDHGLIASEKILPRKQGEWTAFGSTVTLNGETIAPPVWKRPGLKKDKTIPEWDGSWKLYELDEVPFEDQEYYMREPTPITLKAGWNHVKLTLPMPTPVRGWYTHQWYGTFIPLLGTSDRPREVPGLVYSCDPPGELSAQKPNISVFAHYVQSIAKQRGISLAAAADLLHALGVRGFDIGYTNPLLAELATTTCLKPINLYGGLKCLAPDGGEDVMDAFVGAAVKYGVPRIMAIPDNFTKGGDEEAEFRRIVEGVKKLVAKAAKHGITVTVEDFGGQPLNPCNRMVYLKRFLDEVPGLRLALDSGNLYYARRDEDILELMRYAGDRIAHVHLKDQLPTDRRTYAELGLGGVPNAEIVRTVAGTGYTGWWTLENTVDGVDVYTEAVRQVAVLRSWIGEAVPSR